MDLLLPRFIILIIVVVSNLILALIVYRQNRKSATNKIFATLGFVISVWLTVSYFSSTPVTNLFWSRLTIFFATPMSVLFFFFSHTIPSERILLGKKVLIIIATCTLLVMGIAISPFAFVGIKLVGGSPTLIPGPGMLPFSLLTTFFTGAALFLLWKKMRKTSRIEKQQLRLVLFGILVMTGLLIMTVLIPVLLFQNDTFVILTPFYTFIFLSATAYAIFKHHLFDIRVLATEALTFVLAIVTLLEALFSESLNIFIFRISIFLLALSFGILLIRSVRKEVEQREQLEILTKKLEVANVELKRLDAAKSEFISIASHQLRTPLTAAKGYLSLALEGTYGKLAEKVKKPIAKVYESNERLIHLVNDLLSLSRIESGKMKLEPVDTNIEQMIESIVDELKVKATQKNLELIFQKPKSALPILRVDSEKVRNAVLNIIDNSIRYTNKGSITVHAAQLENAIRITITDTGEGMTKEEIAKLFESFSRGEAGAKLSTEGAGLGLYIAKQFVQMHKAKIWAESEGKGKGSTFYIELPSV